jgi:hypothetical protein
MPISSAKEAIMDDDARKLRIRDTFWEAVANAMAGRKDINVAINTTEERDGALFTKVTILSQDGEFQLIFDVAANDEVTVSGPKGLTMRFSLDVDSIASAVRNEIQRELSPKPQAQREYEWAGGRRHWQKHRL